MFWRIFSHNVPNFVLPKRTVSWQQYKIEMSLARDSCDARFFFYGYYYYLRVLLLRVLLSVLPNTIVIDNTYY